MSNREAVNSLPRKTGSTSRILRVLIVEDCKDDAELLVLELERSGYVGRGSTAENGPNVWIREAGTRELIEDRARRAQFWSSFAAAVISGIVSGVLAGLILSGIVSSCKVF